MSRRRLTGPRQGEGGFTLVEVTLTSALLLIVMAILAPLLTGALTTFNRQSDRSGALDAATLTLQEVQHDVYASSVVNVVASPNNELQLIAILPTSPGATTTTTGVAGDTASCIEYRITSGAAPAPLALQREVWALNTTPPPTTTWPTLLSTLKLTGQSAGYVIPNSAGGTTFTTAGSNGQSVNIDLQFQDGSSPVGTLKTTATAVTANTSGASTAAAAWAAQC